jgi:uncharacterized protein YecE (DUF72 family)
MTFQNDASHFGARLAELLGMISDLSVEKMAVDVHVGTAAWNIPSQLKERLSGDGSHLQRYAQAFNCVEINSSFYRDHMAATYERWAETAPENFRFSVKLAKRFTHEQRLDVELEDLRSCLESIAYLGHKWDVLLVQLPPKLELDPAIVNSFFSKLRECYTGKVVLEPRHVSWTGEGAALISEKYSVDFVHADPQVCPPPVSNSHLDYYRLHGTPEIYKSRYDKEFLSQLKSTLIHSDIPSWIIFDNTTFGYATENALELREQLLEM